MHAKDKKKNIDFKKGFAQLEEDPYADGDGKEVVNDQESQLSQQTVSSYRGLFNRMGLPLPRSARVKVEYDLVQKDPKISEQLKEIVKYKDTLGKQVLQEGRKENLISERTYTVNIKKLERWVNSSYRKIDDSAQ